MGARSFQPTEAFFNLSRRVCSKCDACLEGSSTVKLEAKKNGKNGRTAQTGRDPHASLLEADVQVDVELCATQARVIVNGFPYYVDHDCTYRGFKVSRRAVQA